jgi:hypothetical protein
LESRRRQIADYARAHHSWEAVAESTYSVYRKISTVNAT